MMRLDINLATQPYEDGRRFWMRWGTLLGVAGVVTLVLLFVAISSWWTARKDQVQISNFKDQIAKCENERARAQEVLDRPENRSTRDQSQFINGLIRRKAFSWTQVFADLEHMMPPELHVTAIHPEVTKDNQLEIKLSVAGKSRDRALQLIHRMEQSPRFYQPTVEGESATQGQVNGDTTVFEIASTYIPQVEPAAPTPSSADAPKTNSTRTTDATKTPNSPRTGGPKAPKPAVAKAGVLKPAGMKVRLASQVATDRKAH